jgi:hypothetical protein
VINGRFYVSEKRVFEPDPICHYSPRVEWRENKKPATRYTPIAGLHDSKRANVQYESLLLSMILYCSPTTSQPYATYIIQLLQISRDCEAGPHRNHVVLQLHMLVTVLE